MASFSKELTTPVAQAKVTVPDVSRNTSTVQDVGAALSFGMQVHDRVKTNKKEAARKDVLSKGVGIIDKLEDIRGQVDDSQFFREASKLVKTHGFSPSQRLQVDQLVAQHFGASSIGAGAGSARQQRSTRLHNEFGSLKEFSASAMMDAHAGKSIADLSDDEIAEVNSQARQNQQKAIVDANALEKAQIAAAKGEVGGMTDAYTLHEGKTQEILNSAIILHKNNLAIAARTGQDSTEQVVASKAALMGLMKTVRSSTENLMTANQIGGLDKQGLATYKEVHKRAMERIDSSEKFIGDMQDDFFGSYAQIATMLQNKEKINLLKYSPELAKLKGVVGERAFGDLVKEHLVNNTGFKSQLNDIMAKGLGKVVLSKDEAFQFQMGVMAGMGEGKSIKDYNADDQQAVAETMWNTVNSFIKGEDVITNSSKAGVDSMTMSMIEVLEFAEERGTEEDKHRALSLLNSGKIRELYSSPQITPEIKEALGRKVIQYNRETLSTNIAKGVRDQGVTYDTSTSTFKVPLLADEEIASREAATGRLGIHGTPAGVTTARLKANRASRQAVADSLNKQLEVVKRYSQDDAFLTELGSDKARMDFMISSSGIPPHAVEGKLTPINQVQREASRSGMTVSEMESMKKDNLALNQSVDLLKTIDSEFALGNLDEDVQKKLKAILNGEEEKAPVSDEAALAKGIKDESPEVQLEAIKQFNLPFAGDRFKADVENTETFDPTITDEEMMQMDVQAEMQGEDLRADERSAVQQLIEEYRQGPAGDAFDSLPKAEQERFRNMTVDELRDEWRFIFHAR